MLRAAATMMTGIMIMTIYVYARPPTATDGTGPGTARLAAAPPTRPTTSTPTCTGGGCHDAIVDRPLLHGPVAQRSCAACHVELEPREHTFRSPLPPEQQCLACHPTALRDVIHEPLARGECTQCHDPHGSAHRMFLRKDVTKMCLDCHDDRGYDRRRFVHGPVAVGACIVCHEPHTSWYNHLLVRPPENLCVGCHAEVADAARARRHPHPPVLDGRCFECHDPHASEHRGLLITDSHTLCTQCHAPIQNKIAAARTIHGPLRVTPCEEEGEPPSFRAGSASRRSAVAGDRVGGMAASMGGHADGCLACHVGHASEAPALQRNTQPDGCLACHDRPLTTEDGRTLTDMAGLLRNNPHHHGPIREGHCTACHDPHASPHALLLSEEYPPEFYAAFDEQRYRLCFTCHQPEMVTERSGRGVTNFRDGDRNLHHLHVNQEKGRTCRACHEVHASKNPFHMRDTVPFGRDAWPLEIGFRQTDTGGSCAPGCHMPETYDRQDALRVPPARTLEASP